MSGRKANLDDLKTLLNKVADQQNFKQYKVKSIHENEKGDGYIGLISFISIEGIKADDDKAVLDLVIKSAPTNEKVRQDLPFRKIFQNEIFFYESIHTSFRDFQIEYKIPNMFNWTPKCFATCLDICKESLALEDLRASGFRLWDRKVLVNIEHIEFVLKTYGRFHGTSFAMKNLQPQRFQKLSDGMIPGLVADFFKNNSTLPIILDNLIKRYQLGENDELVKKLEEFRDNVVDELLGDALASDEYATVLHGDCWTNNMMFKYENDEETTSPKGIRLLDWQVSYCSSPVMDIGYFFYACSPPENFVNLEYFQKVYYQSLSNHLSQFGLKAEKIYPFEILQLHWKKYAKYCFAFSAFAIKAMLTNAEEVEDMTSMAQEGEHVMSTFLSKFASEDLYYERLKSIANHLYKFKFL